MALRGQYAQEMRRGTGRLRCFCPVRSSYRTCPHTSIHRMEIEKMNTPNKYQSCIDACNSCAAACNACMAACLKEDDVKMMQRCIALDVDCAAMCGLAADAMARDSEMAHHFCRICSEVCLACANECGQHSHVHCKHCADECKKCAKACLEMVS